MNVRDETAGLSREGSGGVGVLVENRAAVVGDEGPSSTGGDSCGGGGGGG